MEISFDTKGNLKPYEKIKLTLDEFEDIFVTRFSDSVQRKHIFDYYLKFVKDFSNQVSQEFTQWINGSFVSAKKNPNDIDFVTIIDFQTFENKERIIHKSFRLEGARMKYNVDAYTIRKYPEGHAKYMLYRSDLVYWHNWFSKTKKNRARKKYPKGFIELEFTKSDYGNTR